MKQEQDLRTYKKINGLYVMCKRCRKNERCGPCLTKLVNGEL